MQFLDDESSKENDAFRNSEWGPEAAQAMCEQVRDFPVISGSTKGVTIGDLIDWSPKDMISKVMLEEKVFETWFDCRTVLIGDGKFATRIVWMRSSWVGRRICSISNTPLLSFSLSLSLLPHSLPQGITAPLSLRKKGSLRRLLDKSTHTYPFFFLYSSTPRAVLVLLMPSMMRLCWPILSTDFLSTPLPVKSRMHSRPTRRSALSGSRRLSAAVPCSEPRLVL